MKLYELSENYNRLYDMVENEEVSLEDVIDTLEAIEDEFEVKAENIVKLIKSIEGDVDKVANEKKRLADREKAMKNKIDNIKSYLHAHMISIGKEKIDTGLFKIAIQNNSSPSLQVHDISKVPQEFLKVKEPEVKASELIKAMKDGLEVEGVEVVRGQHLRIR